MILKFTILAILATIVITSSDPYWGIELSLSPLPSEASGDVREKDWLSNEVLRPYLNDNENRVSDVFKINSYFYPMVNFWFLIYTQFKSNSFVFHDKDNLSIIYKILDFSPLEEKGLSKNSIYILQRKIISEKLTDLKNELQKLSIDPFSNSLSAKKIFYILKKGNINIPEKNAERKKFFRHLSSNIRTQTGQQNFIQDGIIRSIPFEKFLNRYFIKKKLPKELLAIPFLESSFNPKAQSKVNALGIWQFMPLISSYYVPKRNHHFDYRFNVGVASVAASFLMNENYSLMKSWDLAVTAYNSGTRHLLKTKRRLDLKNINLETIIKNSDSKHFGFASKNFYSEFLALVHALAYREKFFHDLHKYDRNDLDIDLKFYLTKCSLKLHQALPPIQLDDIYFHNHHTSEERSSVPKGFILIAKSQLPSDFFYQIPTSELIEKKPKSWSNLVNRLSCKKK
jgi:membrane-bound lytic murein transglycosylase D